LPERLKISEILHKTFTLVRCCNFVSEKTKGFV